MSTGTQVSPKIRDTFLAYARPSIGEEEIAEVCDSLRSGWVTTGPKVKRFQADLAGYVGSSHAIAVNSCTAGLQIALAALGITAGDEVIVPTLTFCATANVVVHMGATPVLVDAGPQFHATAETIARAITPRTKAIMPVHYAGASCDLAAIYELAERYGLPVIEDAAHAIGAEYRGVKIGSDLLLGSSPHSLRIAVYSFYATKNMTTGEGGMIVTPHAELAEQMNLLALHGMSHDAWKRYSNSGSWFYEVLAAGFKANMTDLQAALGIHQLRKLDQFIGIRRRYAAMFNDGFGDLNEIELPNPHGDPGHIYHLYVIRLRLDRLRIDRAQFIDQLRQRNIGASVHFIPVHLHPVYQSRFGYRRGMFPMAEQIYDRIISLPLYPAMTEQDVNDVITAVRQIVSTYTRN